MMRKTQLIKSITTKLSPTQHDAFEARARFQGVGVSEYARQVLLQHLQNPNPNAGIRVLLALIFQELLALRTILLNLVFALASGEQLTPEKMQAWIAHADAEKAVKAQKALSTATEATPEEAQKEAA